MPEPQDPGYVPEEGEPVGVNWESDAPQQPSHEEICRQAGLPHEAVTAFVVALDHHGQWKTSSTVAAVDCMLIEREATMADVLYGAMITAEQARHQQMAVDVTNHTMAAMQVAAQRAQQQLAAAQMAQHLHIPGQPGQR